MDSLEINRFYPTIQIVSIYPRTPSQSQMRRRLSAGTGAGDAGPVDGTRKRQLSQ